MADEGTMTLEEKLRMLAEEIKTVHAFCVNQGYNPRQVEQSAQPLFDAIKKANSKRYISLLYKFGIFVGLFAALFYWDPAYRMACAYSRLATIKILPYWDWTQLYNTDCLIDNPLYIGTPLTEEDCELCENLESIERVNNVSHLVMSEDYLKRDIPVIVTDGMDNWEAQEKFNVHFLHQLYTNEEALKSYLPCMFASNVRVKHANIRSLLAKAVDGSISNWYGHWENCDKNPAKVLRQFYKRPYFMPPMVEVAESNWVFISSQYRGKKNKPADIALPLMWFGQLKGNTQVTLTPKSPCNTTCPILHQTLHAGEILVVTDMMWMLDYMPDGGKENVAIGGGGYFD